MRRLKTHRAVNRALGPRVAAAELGQADGALCGADRRLPNPVTLSCQAVDVDCSACKRITPQPGAPRMPPDYTLPESWTQGTPDQPFKSVMFGASLRGQATHHDAHGVYTRPGPRVANWGGLKWSVVLGLLREGAIKWPRLRAMLEAMVASLPPK